MVGSIGTPVPKASVVQSPPSVITSNYFGYGISGYYISNTFVPGYSYWAKASGGGTLHLNGFGPSAEDKSVPVTNLSALNTLTITDAAGNRQVLYVGDRAQIKENLDSYEMPPAMMDFDARFTSERMVEAYPSQLDKGASYSYPIAITSSAYPVKITYAMNRAVGREFTLSADDKALGVLNGTGVMTLTQPPAKGMVVLTLNEGKPIPTTYELSQNYPNPFNPTTRLNFAMPKASVVEITVYDVLGRKIATLQSGEMSEGYHTVEWNGQDARGIAAPTGVYFVRMTAEDFTATKKVMLMK
jgi:hypothetical protein